MKCLLCNTSVESDVRKETPEERRILAEELSTWQFLSLTVQRNGGNETLKSGHACPDCIEKGLEKIELVMG